MKKFPRQAIILAAGLGTRLRPLTDHIPKPALPVGGVPILFYHLALLRRVGIRDVVINLHHRPKRICALLSRAGQWGFKIRYSFEPKILGTAGGIFQALNTMRKEPTFVLNGDVLCDIDLKAMFRVHHQAAAQATLAAVEPGDTEITSFIESDKKGCIRRIAGEPLLSAPPKKMRKSIFSGIHLLQPELFRSYPEHSFGCVVRQIYQPALGRAERLQAYFHRGAWWDLGTIPQLTQVDTLLYQQKISKSVIELWREAKRLSRGIF